VFGGPLHAGNTWNSRGTAARDLLHRKFSGRGTGSLVTGGVDRQDRRRTERNQTVRNLTGFCHYDLSGIVSSREANVNIGKNEIPNAMQIERSPLRSRQQESSVRVLQSALSTTADHALTIFIGDCAVVNAHFAWEL
jgi:hypothetical protein